MLYMSSDTWVWKCGMYYLGYVMEKIINKTINNISIS